MRASLKAGPGQSPALLSSQHNCCSRPCLGQLGPQPPRTWWQPKTEFPHFYLSSNWRPLTLLGLVALHLLVRLLGRRPHLDQMGSSATVPQ